MLKQERYTPHYIHADTFGPLTDIEQVWKYEDEPVTGPSHYLPWRLNEATYRAGVRVIFDGFDGDTVVCHGVERLNELAIEQRWNEFADAAEVTGKNYDVPPDTIINYYAIGHLRHLAKTGKILDFVKTASGIHNQFNYSRRKLYIKHGIRPAARRILNEIFKRDRDQRKFLFRAGQ